MKRTQDFALIDYLAFVILALVLQPLWSSIYEEWLRRMIERHIAPLGLIVENAPMLALAGIIVVGLHNYFKRQFGLHLADITRPRIKFGDLKEHVEFRDDKTFDQQLIQVQNDGVGILRDCLVIVEKVYWNNDGSTFESRAALATEIRAREGKFGRFNLDAGSPKQIVLTSRDLSDVRNPGRHEIISENLSIPLDRGKSGKIYLVATAVEGGPDRLELKFSVDEKYRLIIEH